MRNHHVYDVSVLMTNLSLYWTTTITKLYSVLLKALASPSTTITYRILHLMTVITASHSTFVSQKKRGLYNSMCSSCLKQHFNIKIVWLHYHTSSVLFGTTFDLPTIGHVQDPLTMHPAITSNRIKLRLGSICIHYCVWNAKEISITLVCCVVSNGFWTLDVCPYQSQPPTHN